MTSCEPPNLPLRALPPLRGGNDQRPTPDWILKGLFKGWFDPCPLSSMPKEDGLTIPWRDRTFVNPPYSDMAAWVEKAILEHRQGKTIALLLKLDSSTKWFLKLQEARAYFITFFQRLRFVNNMNAPFPSVLALLYSHEEAAT